MLSHPTPLPGVLILEPRRFGDDRGWFSETFNQARMAELGCDTVFVQDNHSFSARRGTLRGLHYQAPPHAQAKLVRCTAGAIWDVAVDFRTGSPTFGKWTAAELTSANGLQLLIPAGFLHGFVTLSDTTEVQYKCSDFYAPESDGAVAWNDPQLAIDWPLNGQDPVLSDKDRAARPLSAVQSPFMWTGAQA